MNNLKLLVFFAFIAIVSCEIRIPEKYKNAKDISFHPRYKQTLARKFPKALNINSTVNPFIIGGSPAIRGQIPHQVLIFITFSQFEVYVCGGSLIKNNWVVTAAHCAYGEPEYMQVYAGIAEIDGVASWTAIVYGSEIKVHPEYDDWFLTNDIALLKLISPDIPQNDPYVDVIELPYAHRNLDFDGLTGKISGFGKTSDDNPSVSNELKYNFLKAITNAECALRYVPGLIKDTNICAETNSQASTCGGDSGGPYTFNVNGQESLIGITSFGAAQGCEYGYPAGFTRVTKFLDWIDSEISDTKPPTEKDILQIIKDIFKKIMEILFGIKI